MALDDGAWHLTLITLASNPGIMQRPSIRHLYTHVSLEVDVIAEVCGLEVAFVRDAMMRIP